MIKISASILGINPLYIGENVKEAYNLGIDNFHIDIMDGHYVNDISFGPRIIPEIKKIASSAEIDVHLMINNPELVISDYCKQKPDIIYFHPETVNDTTELIKTIKSFGVRVGVAINPDEEINKFKNWIGMCDEVLLMTVMPGKCGQSMIEYRLRSAQTICELFSSSITVDGGVKLENMAKIAEYKGIKKVVAGSALFTGEIADSIIKFKNFAIGSK